MKCKCPKCGNIHDPKECDPEEDRERADRIEREACFLKNSCPGLSPLDAARMAKKRIDKGELCG